MTKQKKFISVNRFSVQIDIIEHFYEGKKYSIMLSILYVIEIKSTVIENRTSFNDRFSIMLIIPKI
jgi:hypothetical protein